MSEEPHSSNGSAGKNWIEKLAQLFAAEPKNREELVEVIEDAEERDLIDGHTKEMIQGVLGVSTMRVRDIMVPRSQMITINIAQKVDEFLPLLLDSKHSRFPVVSENKDHIEGILLAKDLLAYAFNSDVEFNLADNLRPAIVVPESKKVDSLLKEFRQERYHMAIVVDEYGGVSGLVTIEDVLEEIVGDIEDETDAEDENSENIRKLNSTVYSVDALTELDDFNEFFKSDFNEDDADTIGGIVLHGFGHLPERDEEIDINGFNFRVTSADGRRLLQLQVSIPSEIQTTEEDTDSE